MNLLLTSLGHPNSTIDNGQRVVGLVGDDVDEKLRLSIEAALLSQALKEKFSHSLKEYSVSDIRLLILTYQKYGFCN